jgi:hypothetical protein
VGPPITPFLSIHPREEKKALQDGKMERWWKRSPPLLRLHLSFFLFCKKKKKKARLKSRKILAHGVEKRHSLQRSALVGR